MLLREDVIHFAVRTFLRECGWLLIAGQYPNGSDDELPPLNVVDPEVACDDSPDCRRHSLNKLVPDLVAVRQDELLVIEMKPDYDEGDVSKLEELLGARRADFEACLLDLAGRRRLQLATKVSDLIPLPALAFSDASRKKTGAYRCLRVRQDLSVCLTGPWAK